MKRTKAALATLILLMLPVADACSDARQHQEAVNLECVDSIGGTTYEALRTNVVLGPVTFTDLDDPKSVDVTLAHSGVVKTMLVIAGNTQATVTIASADAREGALLYGPRLQARQRSFYHPADGTQVVKVVSCPGVNYTGYVGGVIATPGKCIQIDVTSFGRQRSSWTLDTGGGACST